MNIILVPVLCWQYLGRRDEENEIIKVLINLSLEFEEIVFTSSMYHLIFLQK